MKEALLLVDIQNDFLPGGALPVSGGDRIISAVRRSLSRFSLILASKDWHPKNHVSFASVWRKPIGETIRHEDLPQILWPDHCVQNTPGASFPDWIPPEKIDKIFFKGYDPDRDSYSIFLDAAGQSASSILSFLHEEKIKNLYLAGLATDYCVKHTALDALRLGFHVTVITDGCKAVNKHPLDGEETLQLLRIKGARLLSSEEL